MAKKIPYAIQNFSKLRKLNYYYVDKTQFIEKLENENAECLMFLRPRRFGKSLFLSTLECYYDINKANDFDELFKGTYIYDHPTSQKNSYHIFKLNFSNVELSEGIDVASKSFHSQILKSIEIFYTYYKSRMGGDVSFKKEISQDIGSSTSFSNFISSLNKRGMKIFLLIDEYDNFANNILTQYGKNVYQDVTQKGGFVRSFFASVKVGVADRTIDKLFMTGVSPMLMSDMTSGFNIATNISLTDCYHNLVGFTQNELEEMVSYYIQEGIIKKEDQKTILKVCKEYYNNYRFSKNNVGSVYNSNLAIFYLDRYCRNNGLHNDLLDQNIMTDYAKLRNLVIYDKKLNGNYSVLSELATTGTISSELVSAFSFENIRKPESFISLLFYLGLITIKGLDDFGDFTFEIPNKTIENIHFGYLRSALSDAFDFNFDDSKIRHALKEMAKTGNAIPALQVMIDTFYASVSLRDFIEREATIKAYILAYLTLVSFFDVYSEREFNKGYADLYLELGAKVTAIKSPSFLIELKYVKAKDNTPEHIAELESQATMQLNQYACDPYFNDKSVKKVILILSSKQVEVLKEIE